MAAVRAQDILDVVLIDTGNVVQKGTERRLVLEKMDDIRLVRGGDLGIRDNEGGEECVCPAAFTAAEAADAQADETVRGLQATPVTAVWTERQAECPHEKKSATLTIIVMKDFVFRKFDLKIEDGNVNIVRGYYQYD